MPNSLNVYIGENAISIPAEIPNRLMLKTVFRDSNDANNFDTLNAGNTWIDGNWHYYTLRIQDFGGASVYIDGILRTNYAVWGANTFDPVTDIFLGGREDLNAGRFFGGLMDETRISTVWRSSNWIRTEFNNQNDPSSFYTVSAEYAPNSACSILPLILNSFNAVRSGPYVRLTWDVENTINTTQYFVERSGNGHDWDLVGNILNTDAFIDSFPYKKESFYRIKYRSGSEIYTSYIRKVEADCCSDEIRIYPNPSSNGIFFISFPGMELPGEVILLDATGQFLQQMRIQKGNNGYYMLQLSQHFGKGVYLLKFKYRNRRHVRKIVVQ
jgi:hypothetical protein